MDAYQNFLNFFSIYGMARFDGLSIDYFNEMNQQQKEKAFNYLLECVENGGSEETVNGIFTADFERALNPVRRLMEAGALNKEAHLIAVSNIFSITKDRDLLPTFIQFMKNSDDNIREKAARLVPSSFFSDELKLALEEMVLTEPSMLAHIHAVNKLLLYHDINEESVGKKKYLSIYRKLRSDDLSVRQQGLQAIDQLFE